LPSRPTSIRIQNLTRRTTVVSAGRVADRFWPRLIGLMLARPLPPGAGLMIVPCSSIHTQFMRFPIDVLYVNNEDVIVGIDRNLRPWRIGRFYKKVHYVVELPAGGAEMCKVRDKLEISEPGTQDADQHAYSSFASEPMFTKNKKIRVHPRRSASLFLPSQLTRDAPPAQAAAG
jgi:uncharacterized protein